MAGLKRKLATKWKDLNLGRKRSFKGGNIHQMADKANITVPDEIINLIKLAQPLTIKKQDPKVIKWVEDNLVKGISVESKPLEQLKTIIAKHQEKLGFTDYSVKGLCIALNTKGVTDFTLLLKIYNGEFGTPLSDFQDSKIVELKKIFEGKKDENS